MALTWQSTIPFDTAFTSEIIAIAASSDTVFVLTADDMITPVTFAGVKGTAFTPTKRAGTDIWRGMDMTEAGNLAIVYNFSNNVARWREYELDGTFVLESSSLNTFGQSIREELRGWCRDVATRDHYLSWEPNASVADRLNAYSTTGGRVTSHSIQSGGGHVTGLASSAAELWVLRGNANIENYDVNIAYVDAIALPTGVTGVDGIAYDGTHVWLADSDNLYYSGAAAGAPDVVTPEVSAGTRQLHLHDNSNLIANLDVTEAVGDALKHLNIPALINASVDVTQLTFAGFEGINLRIIANIAEITPIHVLENIGINDKMFFHSGDADTEPTEIPDLYWEVRGLRNTGNKKQQILICESNRNVV